MNRFKDEMIKETEQVASEYDSTRSNGNKEALAETKPGGAERGGPGRSSAREEQPPRATRPQQKDR